MAAPVLRWARISMVTALATMALKFSAWWLTDSVGLLSDALESIVNLGAASLAFLLLRIAHAPADDEHAFGHEKAEYFSSGAEGALIMAAGLAIIGSAADRWLHPQGVQEISLGLWIAGLAALLNGLVGWGLLRAGKKYQSIALEADGHHLMSDVWTTVGIGVALLLLLWLPGWTWLDPLAALIMAAYLFYTGWGLLFRSFNGLMDVALPEEEQQAIWQEIERELPEGMLAAELRTRQAGVKRFIEFKLLVPPRMSVWDAHATCDQLESRLGQLWAPVVINIHVEPVHCDLP